MDEPSAAPNPLPATRDVAYHPPGCWREPGHHGCAITLLDILATQCHDEYAWALDTASRFIVPDSAQPSLPMGGAS